MSGAELSPGMAAALHAASRDPLTYTVAGWTERDLGALVWFPTCTLEALCRRGLMRLVGPKLPPKRRAYAITDAGRAGLEELAHA